MSDGELVKWIRYLHAAAAVPKDDPDYADAQAAVAHAKRKITFLNRAANRADVETPDAVETARMAALANTAGALAAAPLSMLDLGPGASMMTGPFADFISRIAGKAALDVRGVDTDAYERGMEAHPTATAVGEMVPPVLMALAGRLGTKPAARFTEARLRAMAPTDDFLASVAGRHPSALPRIKADILPGEPGLRPTAVPRVRPLADPLDAPTFLRRKPPAEPPANDASWVWDFIMGRRQ